MFYKWRIFMNRALLVGINAYKASPLRGCINDVMQMKQLLMEYYGFTEESFKLVLDADATTANIKAGLEWLAQGGADPGMVRVFHYSGTAATWPTNRAMSRWPDETPVPVDYKTAGCHRRHLKPFMIASQESNDPNRIQSLRARSPLAAEDVASASAGVALSRHRTTPPESLQMINVPSCARNRKLRDETLSDEEFRADREIFIRLRRSVRYPHAREQHPPGCRPDQTSADAYRRGASRAFTFTWRKPPRSQRQLPPASWPTDGQGFELNHGQIPQLSTAAGEINLSFRPFTA
jgi:hypothetical protein